MRALPKWFLRVDGALYVVWAALCTLTSARLFYGYMLKQTGGEWSAPLDDVFIHFDYARSIARGAPFEWVPGNGFSSGNTSLTYPFMLALGYLGGFRGPELMVWAAILACMCVFGLFIVTRSLFRSAFGDDLIARALLFVVPPLLLGVGALCWSLWSGMEVAFFLGVWALAFRSALDLYQGPPGPMARTRRKAFGLGALGAILCATRPEAAASVLCLGVFATHGSKNFRERIVLLMLCGVPAIALLSLQSWVNWKYTGDTSASGALVKLALFNPYMSPIAKWNDFVANLRYATLRCVEYHFAEEQLVGLILPFLALGALVDKRTRPYALLLWAHVVTWLPVVALNGQVRWQNERYVMPAVAWLVLAAGLGVASFLSRRAKPSLVWGAIAAFALLEWAGYAAHNPRENPEWKMPWLLALLGSLVVAFALRAWMTRGALVVLCLCAFYIFQEDHFRGQRWFFGRAARNIRDQQTTLGRALRELPENALTQGKRRVLVGDAGAILYASDWGGLDIIGLGGFKEMPFARASQHGLAATVELLEHVPAPERPEFLAIFPSWWEALPHWFAERELRRFPAPGNVICGDYEHVLYRADWHLLGTGDDPRLMPAGTREVKDTLDVADIISERAHGYDWAPHTKNGWAVMKTLSDPRAPERDMWDAGRRIEPRTHEQFFLGNLTPGKEATLVLRSAPEHAGKVDVIIEGELVQTVSFSVTGSFVEKPVVVPAAKVRERIQVKLLNQGPDVYVDYHVYVTQ